MRSAAKHLVLIPLAAACAISVAHAAEVQSPKIIIDNLTGQQIPITGTVSFQADGDLRVQCRLDGNNNCPSIGTGNSGSGTNPPTISSFTASATTITAGQSVTLSSASTGDVCFAESPTGITGWTGNALAKSTSQTINGLAVGSYSFGLRCYTAAGSAAATSPTITVNAGSEPPPPPPPTGDYCAEYYANGLPTAPGFNAYGFTKVESTFSNVFGVLPGDIMPSSDVRWVPGNLISQAAGTYLAIPFTMTQNSGPMSQFQLRWFATQIPGAVTGSVSVTISPCPGDFRAASGFGVNPADLYSTNLCRSTFNTASQLVVDSADQQSGCFAPVGKRMFINVAAANIFGGTAPATTSCPINPPSSVCGVSMRND